MFDSEDILTQAFDAVVEGGDTPFTPQDRAHEFDYREGRTDVIMIDKNGDLFAFEMKLVKWKKALYQAYRNTSFAHYSYVVVPQKTANLAAKHEIEFIRRGVGLCAFDGDKVQIIIEATWSKPLRPWLTESAIEYMLGEKRCQMGGDLSTPPERYANKLA